MIYLTEKPQIHSDTLQRALKNFDSMKSAFLPHDARRHAKQDGDGHVIQAFKVGIRTLETGLVAADQHVAEDGRQYDSYCRRHYSMV